jgi:hypothetical protein
MYTIAQKSNAALLFWATVCNSQRPINWAKPVHLTPTKFISKPLISYVLMTINKSGWRWTDRVVSRFPERYRIEIRNSLLNKYAIHDQQQQAHIYTNDNLAIRHNIRLAPSILLVVLNFKNTYVLSHQIITGYYLDLEQKYSADE